MLKFLLANTKYFLKLHGMYSKIKRNLISEQNLLQVCLWVKFSALLHFQSQEKQVLEQLHLEMN